MCMRRRLRSLEGRSPGAYERKLRDEPSFPVPRQTRRPSTAVMEGRNGMGGLVPSKEAGRPKNWARGCREQPSYEKESNDALDDSCANSL